jgi:Ca-activated chloride channel homolog
VILQGAIEIAHTLSDEWRSLSMAGLQFSHRSEARLLLIALVASSVVLLVLRFMIARQPGRNQIILPAMFGVRSRTLAPLVAQVPRVVGLVGLGFLMLAVADPSTALVRRESEYPGRRICLTIDASNSMSSPFTTRTLKTQSETEQAFFTTVAAAELFVQMRREGRFRDLIGLVEFGSEAYVVTPFTNDYDNILLSLSLIGAPREFATFPDQRTLIANAIEESVELFKTFKFLDASGNLLVIFSDGEDTIAAAQGRSLDDIIASAVQAGVPVYFVRTNYNLKEGEHIPDYLWADAVRKTGGKFFAASDEPSLLAAIREIDEVAAGTVRMTEYASQQPRFTIFASLAALCFVVAVASRLSVPVFQRFP